MLYRQLSRMTPPAPAKRTTKKSKVYASWTGRNGRKITAEVLTDADGNEYCNVESGTWYARYTDSAGRRIQRSTGCTDKNAAEGVLNQWRGKSEKVKAGYMRAAEEHADRRGPLLFKDMQAQYIEALRRGWSKTRKKARPASEKHLYFTEHVLNQFRERCGIHRLIDFTGASVQKHLDGLQDEGLSARYRNHHRAILSGFASYCVFHDHLQDNPVVKAAVADVDLDKRRKPRALTDAEVGALLDAAAARPLKSFMEKNTGPVDLDKVDPETLSALNRTGKQRRLIYLTLWHTGLRWGELRKVEVRDVDFKGAHPHIRLKATGTKGKRDDVAPLSSALRDTLKAWIQEDARIGASKLFDMPENGIRVFDKDLAAAKIPKTTHDGIACPHSLRHSLGTRLAKSNTPIAVTKAIMRHSDIKTTMDYYTHLTLIDAQHAVESLPGLPDATMADDAAVEK